MPVRLAKAGVISLTKTSGASALREILVGFGWPDVQSPAELDASSITLGANAQALSDEDFVFYNNLESPGGAVQHRGDQLIGGDRVEDDQQIVVNFDRLPPQAVSIVFVVSIDQADSFGRLDGTFVRLANPQTGAEFARFSLGDGASDDTALVFGSLYRSNTEWLFRAVGDGVPGGLVAVVRHFGVDAG